MKIIIIGVGKVGYALSQSLSAEGHDVTVIDNNPKVIERVDNTLDVMPIKGNGFSTSTLLDAGCNEADFVITVSGKDEINMLCCLTAKKLGAKHTAARIRDPQYARELLLIKEDLGLDMVINPEEASADEIARLLTIPGAIKIQNFAKGRVRMMDFIVREDMPIAGMQLKSIAATYSIPILIGAVTRQNELIIPNGDFRIEAGDSVFIIGKTADVFSFSKILSPTPTKVRNVMIIGGSKIAYYLARLLEQMHIRVKLIEKDEAMCEQLAEDLPQTLVINGDGTDAALLQSEQLANVDGFVSLTGSDEENIIASILAKQASVQCIMTKMSKNHCDQLTGPLGLDIVIKPQEIITNQILKFVRGQSIETLHRILGDEGEIIELIATADDPIVGIPLSKLHLVPDVLITTIVRKNAVVIPTGNDSVQIGDRVLMITKNHINSFKDIVVSTGGIASEFKNSIKKLGNVIGM
ncbi:MAG: Trk system potassium transporter TrkA [Cellulosilyticum sp.]|nr:Trk system potassium transporter TrkA [Cellulosilyticum sp.]